MKNKYFFTKEFCCCPLNSLNPEKIKQSYTNELKKHEIKRTRYLNLVSQVLGFSGWTQYLKEYDDSIIPFLKENGLFKYAPECNLNILKAKNDLYFSYRQVSDRLFYDDRPYPKKIFTAYECKTDNFAYYYPYRINLNDISFNNLTTNGLNKFTYQKKILESNEYRQIIKKYDLDYLIPMGLWDFYGYHNLLSDLFMDNEGQIEDKYIFNMYESHKGLIEQKEYTKIAKLLKNHLLTIKKGWIEVVPFNDNLIFLKANDGTYDFVFKNLRESKFQSPYNNYIKTKYIPSLLNEDFDFKRWLYYGFKKEPKKLKTFEPYEIWEEKDEHLAEINFYKDNDFKDYPGSLNILKEYYLQKGKYSYIKRELTKVDISFSKVDIGFSKVEIPNKTLYISQLITIKEFFKFYNSEYKEERATSLDEIYTNNLDNENMPVSVTWYDAIAYCRYLEKEYNIPARLIFSNEFSEICANKKEQENIWETDVESELAFYIGNEQLPSPPPRMDNFDDVIIKYKNDLNFVSNQGIKFCTNSTFREWSNNFKSGFAAALSGRYPEIEENHLNSSFYSYQANLNYKYKYMKIGFRVCYEVSKGEK